MLSVLVKYAAPLMVILSLTIMVGASSSWVSPVKEQVADLCCDHPEPSQQSAPEGECSDPGCRCQSCNESTVTFLSLSSATSQMNKARPDRLTPVPPSGYIASIDYPPEFS